MTPLEQRIAKVINHDWTCDSRATDGEVFNESLCDCGLADKARAVVAVLPTADVSDDDIEAALSVDLSAFPDFGAINRALVANVRALLDAQAAAHAAEVDALRVEKASMTEAYQAASASLAKANVAIANMDDNFDRQEAATEVALAEVRADRDAYRARIDAVRAIHPDRGTELGPPWCPTCSAAHPCETVAALDGDA